MKTLLVIFLLGALCPTGPFVSAKDNKKPKEESVRETKSPENIEGYRDHDFRVKYFMKSAPGESDDKAKEACAKVEWPEDAIEIVEPGSRLLRIGNGKNLPANPMAGKDIIQQCLFGMVEVCFTDFGKKTTIKANAKNQPLEDFQIKIEKTKTDKGYDRVVCSAKVSGEVKCEGKIWKYECDWSANYDPFVNQIEDFTMNWKAVKSGSGRVCEVDVSHDILKTDDKAVVCMIKGIVTRKKAPADAIDPEAARAIGKGIEHVKKDLESLMKREVKDYRVNYVEYARTPNVDYFKVAMILYVMLHHGEKADADVVQDCVKFLNKGGIKFLNGDYISDYGAPCVLLACEAYENALEDCGKNDKLEKHQELARRALDSMLPPKRNLNGAWGDISRTQFALLGIHAASKMEMFDLKNEKHRQVLLDVMKIIMNSKMNSKEEIVLQKPYNGTLPGSKAEKKNDDKKEKDGSAIVIKCSPAVWPYSTMMVMKKQNIGKMSDIRKTSYGAMGNLAMTCNGIGSLAICYELLMQEPEAKPRLNVDQQREVYQALNEGLLAVQEMYDAKLLYVDNKQKVQFGLQGFNYYLIYCLERVGVLCNRKEFGANNWYSDGASPIIKAQAEDGGWGGQLSWTDDLEMNPIYAILFLAKATAPIAPASGK